MNIAGQISSGGRRLRRARLVFAWLGLALSISLALNAVEADRATAATKKCGVKRLYGHSIDIRERGEPMPCSRVRRIVQGPCEIGRVWSCFSFRPPNPILVWFRERERFEAHWSSAIEGLRYPCSKASVTPRAWAKARESGTGLYSDRFPTRTQVLADDLMRCHLLSRWKQDAVIALLGRPDEKSSHDGATFLDYYIGPERDSFFQVDPELLSVKIGPKGAVADTSMYQG